MRVTDQRMADMARLQLARGSETLYRLDEQVASGKKILRPSDDPVQMADILACREALATVDQYGRNITQAESWLTVSESVLGEIGDLVTRAKELAVVQSSGTATERTRSIASAEIASIYDQMMHLSNTRIGDRYLFGGHQTGTAPFVRDDGYTASYNGDEGKIRACIGQGVTVEVNTDGREAFMNEVDVFAVMKDLKDALEGNDPDAVAATLPLLDGASMQVLVSRAQAGAGLNRLEAARAHWDSFRLNTQRLLSETEDVDIASAMADLKLQETAYQALLTATATAIQPSLLHFLD